MFNNAGIVGAHGGIDEIPLEEYEFTMAVLLRSVFLGMKHAARVMKPQGSGVILSTIEHRRPAGRPRPARLRRGEGGGRRPDHERRGRARGLGHPRQRDRPGKILTPMNAANLTGDPDAMDEAREAFATRTPLRGRIGEAFDIGHAALWLASDDAGFVSGHTLVVDGGLTTGSKENVAPGEHGRWASRRDLVREAGRSGVPADTDV